MEIPLGMQMAIKAFAKLFGFDPALMVRNLEIMSAALHSVAADMASIRRQNTAIMAHLGITEDEHARPVVAARNGLDRSGHETGCEGGGAENASSGT